MSVVLELNVHLSLPLLPTPCWGIEKNVFRHRWMNIYPSLSSKIISSKPFSNVLHSTVVSWRRERLSNRMQRRLCYWALHQIGLQPQSLPQVPPPQRDRQSCHKHTPLLDQLTMGQWRVLKLQMFKRAH